MQSISTLCIRAMAVFLILFNISLSAAYLPIFIAGPSKSALPLVMIGPLATLVIAVALVIFAPFISRLVLPKNPQAGFDDLNLAFVANIGTGLLGLYLMALGGSALAAQAWGLFFPPELPFAGESADMADMRAKRDQARYIAGAVGSVIKLSIGGALLMNAGWLARFLRQRAAF